MGGRASRNKGKRSEYQARDIMREMGWTSNRVPSSGASQGFKGDVAIEKGDLKLKIEVKSRKTEFKEIYSLLGQFGTPLKISDKGQFVVLSYSFHDLGFEVKEPQLYTALTGRTVAKILNMRKLLKEADFLMIRDDRRPFIFIRYFGGVRC